MYLAYMNELSCKTGLIVLLMLACMATSQAQETLSKQLSLNGTTRDYIIYVPAVYDATTPVPLMFNFHGYLGQAEDHMNSTEMKPVADTAGFIVVYPQGSRFFGATHWNVGAWTAGSPADDLGFTEAMIDSVSEVYNIDQDRIYSCGFSNGGYFSFELACQLSERFAAIGSVGGKMSSETYAACSPSHAMPVITIHGTSDNVVSYSDSRPSGSKSVEQSRDFWISYNQIDRTPIVSDIPDSPIPDESTVQRYFFGNGISCSAIEHYRVIGGGHSWPGAWGNKDIDASAAIWDFVSQFDINGRIDCMSTAQVDLSAASDHLLVYPNPASAYIFIESEGSEISQYRIYSLLGQLLDTGTATPSQEINVTHLVPGTYILKTRTRVAQFSIVE